jgi:hypothetical protein
MQRTIVVVLSLSRGCTDILWLLLFIASFGGMLGQWQRSSDVGDRQ